LKSKYVDLVGRIEDTKDLSKDDEVALRAAIEDFKRSGSF
jgi:F-type H+-transporting ATPase subunit alpha